MALFRPKKPAVDETPWSYDGDDFKSARYVLTDDGLSAMVNGKLKCSPVDADKERLKGYFMVGYDGMVINSRRIVFQWNGINIMELDLPNIREGDTITLADLDGKIPLKISN